MESIVQTILELIMYKIRDYNVYNNLNPSMDFYKEINGYSCCAEGNALISDTENLEWANWEGDVQISTLDGDVLYEKSHYFMYDYTKNSNGICINKI